MQRPSLLALILGWALAILTGPTALAEQLLTPAMQADRYLLQAERHIQNTNYAVALRSLDRVVRLESEHDLELPERFWVTYAEVALEAGSYRRAFLAAMRHLESVDRSKEHSAAALRVLEEAEAKNADELVEVRAVAADMEFVWVPPGDFRMGTTSKEGDRDEYPRTQVRITQGFWFGKYEVIQTEWGGRDGNESVAFWRLRALPGGTGVLGGRAGVHLDVECGGRRKSVSLADGRRSGSTRRGREPGGTGMRAAWTPLRGALTTARGRRIRWDKKHRTPGGCMTWLGNVWEWVEDRYGDYPGGRVTDPRGPGLGSLRVLRGGGWSNRARHCRTSSRSNDDPDYGYVNVGLRLLRAP